MGFWQRLARRRPQKKFIPSTRISTSWRYQDPTVAQEEVDLEPSITDLSAAPDSHALEDIVSSPEGGQGPSFLPRYSTVPARPRLRFWALWWHAIDRWIFLSTLALIAIGTWLIMTVIPAIAMQHKWSPLVLLNRHLFLLAPGIGLMIVTSLARRKNLVRACMVIGVMAWLGVFATLVVGNEIKGAKRWLNLAGFSLQPSELLKPSLAIILAHVWVTYQNFGVVLAVAGLAIMPLLLQPDVGMAVVLGVISFGQCFVAGLPWFWTIGAGLSAGMAGLGVYLLFPHAAHRIQAFLQGGQADPFGSQYQIMQALKSFASGGIWGRGPGAGEVLNALPDGHADFIFAVAGEELGLVACLGIIALYGIMIGRGLWAAGRESQPFYTIAVTGLVVQMAFQTALNMASVLRLVPTKGVTLPFLSYGGSSFLSLCWAMGMVLALTRRYRGLL